MKIKSISVKPTQEKLVLEANKAVIKMHGNFKCNRNCQNCPYFNFDSEYHCAYDDVFVSMQRIMASFGY